MRALVGHLLPNELETNSPTRLALGSEIELNRKCWRATRQVWSEMSSGTLASWMLGKWATYWFGTDQLLHPGHISRANRALHVLEVAFYWVLLMLASVGWWKLWQTRRQIGALLVGYVVLMTLVHTPFVMNTRIRAPLIDPLIA